MKKKPTYEELEKRVQELTQNQKKYEFIQEVADIGSRNWNITKDNKPIRFAGTQHNITDKVHAEELLQESEEKYRMLVESMNDVIVQLSPAGKLLYVSPNVKEFGGYDPKSEIGNDMSKYFANDTDIIRAVVLLEKVSETHQTGSFEFLFKAKDKKPFYVESTYFPIVKENKLTAIQLVLHDITQRKQAEDMLIEKTMYLDNILQSSIKYAIATTDLNFCITYYNPLAEKFFGYTAKEVIGKTVQEMHTREHVDSKRFDEAIEIIRTRGEYCYRLKQETDTGTCYFDLRVTGIYDNARNLVGFALFSHDITTRIKAEQELKYSKLQLEAVFNNLDSIIYITDMDSCEILYMNDYMKKVLGKDCTGKICWKSIHNNQDGPCDFCKNDKLIDAGGNPKEPYIWEFYNQKLNRWYELHDQAIPWTDGRLVRMEIALDITERMQAQEKINASLKEKVVLLREIHHRVKNNMQVILSLLRMHGRRINDANLSKVFEDCRDRINAMSLIHESLYQSNDLAKIDFKVYLQKLCQNLSTAYGASGKGIILTVGECNVALDMDQSIAIGMVIAELISNAIKYAFPLGKGGNVSISLSEIDAENVKLIIKDDGKGMPLEIDIMNSSSLGLRLAVSAVTMELGGSIEVERDKGTQFTICFKYKRK